MKIGFVGLGKMGLPMASRVLAAGHEVIGADPSATARAEFAAKGAGTAELADLATTCDVVLMSLPTPQVVAAVTGTLADAAAAAGAKPIVVDLSTSGPSAVIAAAERLGAAGARLVDSPVSGGVAGAVEGSLALMVAGAPGDVEVVLPILQAIGKPVVVGDKPGMGQMLKLVNNMISASALAVTSEAMVLATKAGLDPEKVIELLNISSGRTSASTSKIPKHVLNRRFDFGMSVGLSVKDLQLCLEEAGRHGVPMLVGRTVGELYSLTKGLHGADADMTEIIRPIESWSGVEVGRAG